MSFSWTYQYYLFFCRIQDLYIYIYIKRHNGLSRTLNKVESCYKLNFNVQM